MNSTTTAPTVLPEDNRGAPLDLRTRRASIASTSRRGSYMPGNPTRRSILKTKKAVSSSSIFTKQSTKPTATTSSRSLLEEESAESETTLDRMEMERRARINKWETANIHSRSANTPNEEEAVEKTSKKNITDRLPKKTVVNKKEPVSTNTFKEEATNKPAKNSATPRPASAPEKQFGVPNNRSSATENIVNDTAKASTKEPDRDTTYRISFTAKNKSVPRKQEPSRDTTYRMVRSMNSLKFLFLAACVCAHFVESIKMPFLTKKKYTPLLFFTVPRDYSPENDELEKCVSQVEKELGVSVERLDVMRDPPSQALLGLLTRQSPPLLYNRESCQVISLGGSKPASIDKSRVRAWAKGRYLPPRKQPGSSNELMPKGSSSANDQEGLLEDLSLTPLQKKGRDSINEGTMSKAKSKS